MSRRAVIRELPPLRSVLPHADRSAEENRSEGLLPRLRVAVERVRKEQSVAFYSMREVAAETGVSMKAVARAFRRLQAEGLLVCLRGSRTLVAGRKRQPQRPVRGVVGMAVYLPSFVGSSGWQELYTALEEELRRHDYVADFVFFQSDEDLTPDFAERLLRHQLDVLLWYAPAADAAHGTAVAATLASMRDAGVKTVVVGGSASLSTQYAPAPGDAEAARKLRPWAEGGVTEVQLWVVPEESNLWAAHENTGYPQAAHDCGLRWTIERVPADRIPALSASLPPSVGIIFQEAAWLESLFDAHPKPMRRLCTTHRVLLAYGRPPRPIPAARGIAVEASVSTMSAIAKRVATDIASGAAWTHDRPVLLRSSSTESVTLG